MSGDADNPRGSLRTPAQAALVVGALGVVFGDIGTSHLYTAFLTTNSPSAQKWHSILFR